jgi:L-carnitine CoA-transferase
VQSGLPIEGFTYGKQPARTGAANDKAANDVVYKTLDGEWMVFNIGSSYHKVACMAGLGDDPDFAPPLNFLARNDPRAPKFLAAITEFIASRTLDENAQAFADAGLPMNVVMTYERMKNNSHYQARGIIEQWHDPIEDEEVKGIGIVPRFQRYPGQIFRCSPTYGMDNEDILAELGYSEAEISDLYEKEVISNKMEK